METKRKIHPILAIVYARGTTIRKVAYEAGVAPETLSRIINGKGPCSMRIGKAIEKVTGLNWRSLVVLEPEDFKKVA